MPAKTNAQRIAKAISSLTDLSYAQALEVIRSNGRNTGTAAMLKDQPKPNSVVAAEPGAVCDLCSAPAVTCDLDVDTDDDSGFRCATCPPAEQRTPLPVAGSKSENLSASTREPTDPLYVLAWSGGYEDPLYDALATREAAVELLIKYAADCKEGEDTIDVLQIDPVTLKLTQVELTEEEQARAHRARDSE